MCAHVENVGGAKKTKPQNNKKSLKSRNKQRALSLKYWMQYLNLCKVQCSNKDLTFTYQAVVVLIPFFPTLQIKRADLEPEILSSTEETEFFYNRGI